MFTDMVDSTRIKGLIEGETSGRRDSYFRSHIKEPHDAVILACVYEAGGYIVNPTGDGFCITFVDAEEAVLCALRIQQHLAQHPIRTPLGDLQIRIGLHTGIAGPSGDDYIASTVDKTARVQGKAGGGEVFVSHQTQVLVSDKTQGVQFEPRGIFDLKGLQAEELYQAVPHAKLVLPPISDEALASPQLNDFESQTYRPGSSNKSAKSSGGKKNLAVALGGMAIAALLGGALWQGVPRPDPVLPVGSQWDGSFHFMPPMDNYDGSVSMEITERSGERFKAIYATENKSYQWLVEGTVKGNNLRWTFVKAIKNPGSEDAVGKAYCDATVDGDKMQGFFRMTTNRNEVAELDLSATKGK
jgi:class 3 adenylate cyclase